MNPPESDQVRQLVILAVPEDMLCGQRGNADRLPRLENVPLAVEVVNQRGFPIVGHINHHGVTTSPKTVKTAVLVLPDAVLTQTKNAPVV